MYEYYNGSLGPYRIDTSAGTVEYYWPHNSLSNNKGWTIDSSVSPEDVRNGSPYYKPSTEGEALQAIVGWEIALHRNYEAIV